MRKRKEIKSIFNLSQYMSNHKQQKYKNSNRPNMSVAMKQIGKKKNLFPYSSKITVFSNSSVEEKETIGGSLLKQLLTNFTPKLKTNKNKKKYIYLYLM
jgi:hypothetical protein